jgi:hypothetical protein
VGSLLGLKLARRSLPQVQRPINSLWAAGMQFLVMPGVGWGFPSSNVVAPTTSGTYSDIAYGQAYKAGARAKSWTTTNVSLGNEYTLLAIASYVSSQGLISDDSPTSNLILQCGGVAGKFSLSAYNTSNTAYTATSSAVSTNEQVTGTIVGGRVSSKGFSVSLTIDGVTTSHFTTGTIRSPTNPNIGSTKGSTVANSVVALAAAWNYVMSDAQLLTLLSNPAIMFD